MLGRPLLLGAVTLAVAAVAFVLTLIARRVALRVGFVDRPGGHKSHAAPMPYGGGCAIVAAGWGALALMMLAAAVVPDAWISARFGERLLPYVGGVRTRTPQMLWILLGGLILHGVGLLDDRRPLGPWWKLAVIAGVAVLAATRGGVRLAELWGPEVSVILTTLWFIVIVNAFNFLDNMDGLSAGVAVLCLAFFAAFGLLAGQVLVPALGAVFCGAVLGFLVLNFPPARIFMGDAGSLVVGYMLATVSTLTTYYQPAAAAVGGLAGGAGAAAGVTSAAVGGAAAAVRPYVLAAPLVVLAIPLYDFVSVVVIRLLEGRNPMRGDQRHFSHRLVERGLSRRQAVLTIYLATATTGLAATLLPGAGLVRTVTIGLLVLLVLAIIAILEAPLRRGNGGV